MTIMNCRFCRCLRTFLEVGVKVIFRCSVLTRGRATNSLAVPLAGTIRLSARHRRISLHGFDAGTLDRLACLPRRSLEQRRVNQVFRSNARLEVGRADDFRSDPWLWIIGAGLARDL